MRARPLLMHAWGMDDDLVDEDGLDEALYWTLLPVNRIWTDSQSLFKSLLDTAQHHANIALEDFTKDGNVKATAGLHAGIAAEHMAKCYLATLHPILLADKGCDVDTLLHLVGKGKLAKSVPYAIKTIGGVEACRRTRYFLPEFRFNEQTDGLLFSVRNSVGHLGLTVDVDKAIRIMVRLIDMLLDAVGRKRRMFWGNKIPIVNLLQNENLTEQQAILETKYETARNFLKTRFWGLDQAGEATVRAILAKGSHTSGDYDQPYLCPVCGSQGWLICERHHEFNEDDVATYRDPYAYPFLFKCNVCELSLEYNELERAGMPGYIELPDSGIGKGVLTNTQTNAAWLYETT